MCTGVHIKASGEWIVYTVLHCGKVERKTDTVSYYFEARVSSDRTLMCLRSRGCVDHNTSRLHESAERDYFCCNSYP